MNNYTIGVLGGMGTYATIHLFRQYAEVFEADKEWERPRIIIDNRCTMPSRVKAYLQNENVDLLVEEMADSLSRLIDSGCTRILLACNTSHLFLPKIYEKIPEAENYVYNIVNACVEKVSKDKSEPVYLIGSEGTIESGIYQSKLKLNSVECMVPTVNDYSCVRECIESVKQNRITDYHKEKFLKLVNDKRRCILGCTELPVLYDMFCNDVVCSEIYDPILLALKDLKEEWCNG